MIPSRNNPKPPPLRLKTQSDPATLAQTRRAIEMFAAQCGFDETARGEIGLVINEALANVIRHAYQGATDQPIELSAQNTDEGICITIRDWGTGINPLELPPRKHDPLKPGGVGLICMRQMMDEVDYRKQPDGMLLTMRRSRLRPKVQGAKEAC
ncbi:MAG TPA: ATP-binding protein [Tepidisphaeraceae bacterium]|jgi:serine/threonine-protein kinase RsbW|nr:ATP-binding protein [Tepidisphaeraceae bacterium]